MRDIWNPWHGCVKKSEGCRHCYMYFLDKKRGQNGADIYRVKNKFDYPLARDKDGRYKIRSGETLRVCLTSDFFLEQADAWRPAAWDIIRRRSDVVFMLLTKRPERVASCLPDEWGDGWDNVFFNVTCENQIRADERIPLLFSLPFKHKGIMVAPFIGAVDIRDFLETGKIEQVIAGGENYDGARPLHYEWVKKLYDDCAATNTRFCFMETGTVFVKDGKTYHLPSKALQSVQAFKSGLRVEGRPLAFKLTPPENEMFFSESVYEKKFKPHCHLCGGKMICNGCAFCKNCPNEKS